MPDWVLTGWQVTWLRPQNLGTVESGERGDLATFVCDLMTVSRRGWGVPAATHQVRKDIEVMLG